MKPKALTTRGTHKSSPKAGNAPRTSRGAPTPPNNSAFERVAAHFQRDPAVTHARMFGAEALKAAGKVFAMTVKGELVVKVPAARVDALIAQGIGTRFDPGHGKVMREWVSISPDHRAIWDTLTREAREFAAQ